MVAYGITRNDVELKRRFFWGLSGVRWLRYSRTMEILVKFYPKHIEKEDKHFFIPCMDYFTAQERDKILLVMIKK